MNSNDCVFIALAITVSASLIYLGLWFASETIAKAIREAADKLRAK